MALSLFQKVKLAFRGWARRRRDAAAAKDAEFLSRAASWSQKPSAPQPVVARKPDDGPGREVDVEGLQVAYLDESQRNRYYLDVSTGEVIFVSSDETGRESELEQQTVRYRRVPSRTLQSEQDDRMQFLASLEREEWKARLAPVVDDPAAFRQSLSSDRQLERAWYNFKNDRATAAIEKWLRAFGL